MSFDISSLWSQDQVTWQPCFLCSTYWSSPTTIVLQRRHMWESSSSSSIWKDYILRMDAGRFEKWNKRFLFSCCRWRSCWNCLCSWPPPHPPSPCLHSQCQWAQGEHLLQHSWQPHPQHSNWTDLQRKWVSSLRPKHANKWYIDTIRKEPLACSLALARCCLWRGCALPRTLSSDMLQGEKLCFLSK